jgi:tetratricopeptide (TPR) repeat protein
LRLILVDAPGLDWSLIDAFSAPSPTGWLHQARRHGAHGELRGLVPATVEALATTLACGRLPYEHGVYGQWIVDGDRIRPQHAADGRLPSIWDYLAADQRDSLVVDWPGYPALALSGTWVAPAWLDHGITAGLSDAGLADELAGLRLDPNVLNPASLLPFVDGLPRAARQPEWTLLKAAVARHVSVQSVVTRLMKRDGWSLLLLRYDLLIRLASHFMTCTDPPLTVAAAARSWSGVMPAALGLLDLSLARLAELAGEQTALMLVSARGTPHGARRPSPGEPAEAWHSEQGLIAMKGPGIAEDARTWGAGLTDVLPTALQLLGLSPPESLPGRSLKEAFASETYANEHRACPLPGEPATPTDASGEWPEDGLPPPRAELAREQARHDAMARLQSGDAAGAKPLLEDLHRACPDDRRTQLHLARCLFALGEHDRAAELTRAFLVAGDREPRAHLILGLIELERQRPDHALTHFFQAEQTCPDSPVVHCRIGDAYLLAERPDEARRGFERALDLDEHHAPAHDGMARAWLQAGDNTRAVDAALTAIEIDYRDASAHFHLGVALARLERYGESISAFNQCLAVAPQRIEAHQWLAELHRRVTGDILQASRHQVIADRHRSDGDRSRPRSMPV